MFKRIILSLMSLLLVCGVSLADDDREKNKKDAQIKFIYNKMDVGMGAVESGHYFTGPSGTVYLFPYWAQTTPKPTPTPTPKPTPTVTPVPKIPNKENAFNSCMQCHKSTNAKYSFANWTDALHKKVSHKSKACSSCHNIL